MNKFFEEKSQARSTAQDLKRCQLQYFVFSITVTGAILSFSKSLIINNPSIIMLSPLLIILPCWMMFFDKATTLTRLVGYIRILEDIIGEIEGVHPIYVGYENALSRFRKKEGINSTHLFKGFVAQNMRILILWGNRHQFWTINWWTFAFLSIICWCLAIIPNFTQFISSNILFILAITSLLAIISCGLYTFALVYQLTKGRLSYDSAAQFWRTFMPSHQNFNQP